MAKDEDVWFEPRRFGYGAGLPVAWQGWALLGGWIAALAATGYVLPPPRHPVAYAVVVVACTVALLVTVARHTRGGWRWRWGDDTGAGA